MRRTSTVLVGAGLLLLTACSGGEAGGGVSPSTSSSASPSAAQSVLIWADPTLAPALAEISLTHKAATGVEVVIQPMQTDAIHDDLPTLAAQGQGPDLVVGRSDWVGEFSDIGLLAPIDLSTHRARFRPISVAAFTYEQKTYGVPFATENLALLRNTDLAPEPPESIESMAAEGLALKKAKKVDLPIALPVGPQGDAFHWYPLYSASGGYIFLHDASGSYSTEPLGVGEPGSIRAARDLAELTDQGVLDPDVTSAAAVAAFAEGRAAYLISGPWAVAPAATAGIPLVVEAVPGSAGTTRPLSQSLVTAQGFLLSAFARNSAGAIDFLTRSVMTTPSMDALFAAGGQVPAWSDSYETAAADPVVAGFGTVADASVATPNLAVMQEVWTTLGRAEVDLMDGAPPAATMKQAGSQIQDAIDAQ